MECVFIFSSIALVLNSMCVVAMYGSPYESKTTFFFFAFCKISFPSSTNHLFAGLNSPFVMFLILAKSDFPIGLVNCSRYTISAFDKMSSASLGIDLNPEIPKPTNQSITASFYHEVFLNAEEFS